MIETNIKNFKNELLDIVKIFYPENFGAIDIKHALKRGDGEYANFFNVYNTEYSIKHNNAEYYAKEGNYRVLHRIIKADLYKILSKISNRKSLWGSLTGIRPVKLYKDTLIEFGDRTDEYFSDFLSVSKEKLALIKNIAKVQQSLPVSTKNDCDLYIGIPFCNGRCNYCSFVSADINRAESFIKPYTDALIREITSLKELVKLKGLKVRAIYIGGGTPSSFSIKNLEKIFQAIEGFDPIEYTFEAGRPDSVTKELLDLLSEYGVNRISINPQTVNDITLQLIGRNHTFADVLNAYELSKKYKFFINMDIIAGLEGEGLKDFKNTLNKVVNLNPDNITVHTLCLKKGSAIKNDLEKQKAGLKKLNILQEIKNVKKPAVEICKLPESAACDILKNNIADAAEVFKMLDYARESLEKNNYDPYYLYRQKYSVQNLENIGFCKDDKICLYNVDNMDDTVSILACGANAISKRIWEGGRIERCANPKDIKTYIEKVEIINLAKNELFK